MAGRTAKSSGRGGPSGRLDAGEMATADRTISAQLSGGSPSGARTIASAARKPANSFESAHYRGISIDPE